MDHSDDDVVDHLCPLWRYVTKGQKVGVGGTVHFTCNFCGLSKQGTYTRIRAHLLCLSNKGIVTCKKVKMADRMEMLKLDEEATKKALELQDKHVSLPSSADSIPSPPVPPLGSYIDPFAAPMSSSVGTSSSPFMNKKRMADASNSISKAFNLNARHELDSLIARLFYVGGLPFNLIRNPCSRAVINYATNHHLASYVPPSYNRLRTTLLDAECTHIGKLLEPIKRTWKEKGVSIVTDGWSDIHKRPLINFIAISDGGPMFLRAVNASGEVKDKYYIADLLKDVIDDVGAENVVQVITDNASNCKGAGEIIENMYPHIFWTPCVVHTLNLALKNICHAKNVENNIETFDECHWITEIHADASQIKLFITNHSMRLAIYNKYSSLKLLSIADTRFASIVVMLKRLKLVKCGLQAMTISDEWTTYKRDDVGRASFVKELLLDDSWWAKVDYILEFTRPIYDMIRQCDTDRSCLHLCYEMWDEMIVGVKSAIYKKEGKLLGDYSSFYQVVYNILVSRWTKNNTPLHCMAHSLNPRYYGDAWLIENPMKLSPHRNDDISRERNKCFARLFPDHSDRAKAKSEFTEFSLMTMSFEDSESINDRTSLDPKVWWTNYGSSAPLLQSVALKLLGQVSSSSCSERNWSTYSFIHSLSRNRLLPTRAERLVFVHNNYRLLARRNPEYKSSGSSSKFWDVFGDEFDNFQDTSLHEISSLSLDDPEIECMYPSDDVPPPVGLPDSLV